VFETLEDKFEESKKPLDPGLPILMYSASALGSCIAIFLGMEGMAFLTCSALSSGPRCSCYL